MPARTGRSYPSRPPISMWRRPTTFAATLSFLAFGQAIQRSLNPATDYPYAATVTCYLEVHGKVTAGTLYARLKNMTTGLYVGGAEAQITSTSTIRARSLSFSLDAGTNTYEVDFGGVAAQTYTLYDAVVIVVLT